MGLLNLLLKNPGAFIIVAVPLLYAIILHELAHGWVAYRLGDPTAKMHGRLTLNPISHLDPIGTLMLFIFGFGWAKPVPVNFNRLRPVKAGMVMVSAAGIVTNFLMAFIAMFVLRLFAPPPFSLMAQCLTTMAQINVILAAFNLIPIPPLDGSKILLAFAPLEIRNFLFSIERYGLFILIGLLYLHALDPVFNFLFWLINSFIQILLP